MGKVIECYDEMDYRIYTGKSEMDKAVSSLRGMIEGIVIDGEVNDFEVKELANWISVNDGLEKYLPFSELLPMLRCILKDGVVDDDEIQDLLWICSSFSDGGKFYDLITLSIQELEGIFHGLLADNSLNDNEIRSLNFWLENNSILKGTYPYDEISALISDVLSDGVIDEIERMQIKVFISNFIDCKTSYNLNELELIELRNQYKIVGICCRDPFVDIEDHTFCFTGKSSRATRSDIEKVIIENDGYFNNGLVKTTDYLLVGDEGNPCWAFSCYGRKVEKAVEMRKNGSKILIIHENDFWKLID